MFIQSNLNENLYKFKCNTDDVIKEASINGRHMCVFDWFKNNICTDDIDKRSQFQYKLNPMFITRSYIYLKVKQKEGYF